MKNNKNKPENNNNACFGLKFGPISRVIIIALIVISCTFMILFHKVGSEPVNTLNVENKCSQFSYEDKELESTIKTLCEDNAKQEESIISLQTQVYNQWLRNKYASVAIATVAIAVILLLKVNTDEKISRIIEK